MLHNSKLAISWPSCDLGQLRVITRTAEIWTTLKPPFGVYLTLIRNAYWLKVNDIFFIIKRLWSDNVQHFISLWRGLHSHLYIVSILFPSFNAWEEYQGVSYTIKVNHLNLRRIAPKIVVPAICGATVNLFSSLWRISLGPRA